MRIADVLNCIVCLNYCRIFEFSVLHCIVALYYENVKADVVCMSIACQYKKITTIRSDLLKNLSVKFFFACALFFFRMDERMYEKQHRITVYIVVFHT